MHMIFAEFKMPELPNPDHADGICRSAIRLDAETPGMAAASLVSNYSGQGLWTFTHYLDEVAEKTMSTIIDDYLAANPGETVEVGYYTPRGRKRRGLPTKQRRVLCVKLGITRHYFPGVTYWNSSFTVTQEGVTARCRCPRNTWIRLPQITTVWPAV